MLSFLSQAAARWRLLGEDEEHAATFFSILAAGRDSAGIGICSISGTLGPSLAVTFSVWMLGYNRDVTTLQMADLTTMGHVRYQTPFYAFANERPEEPYLAIFETGVVALDARGGKLWEYSTDIITRFERAGSRLLLRQMDGPEIAIDTISGQPAARV
jgi:hypothetical protein